MAHNSCAGGVDVPAAGRMGFAVFPINVVGAAHAVFPINVVGAAPNQKNENPAPRRSEPEPSSARSETPFTRYTTPAVPWIQTPP